MGPEVRLRPDGPDLCVLERPCADLAGAREPAGWHLLVGASVRKYAALGLLSPCPARSGVIASGRCHMSGRGSPLGPGHTLVALAGAGVGARARMCLDLGISRPALRALRRLPVGAATCRGAQARSVRATPGLRLLALTLALVRGCVWPWGLFALPCAPWSMGARGSVVWAREPAASGLLLLVGVVLTLVCTDVWRRGRIPPCSVRSGAVLVGAREPAGPGCSLRCPGARVRGVGADVTLHLALGLYPCATLGSICIGVGSLPAFAGMPRLSGRGGGRRLHLSTCTGASVRVCARWRTRLWYVYMCPPLGTYWAWEPACLLLGFAPPSAAGSGRALCGGRCVPFAARSLHKHAVEVCVSSPAALGARLPAATAWTPAELGCVYIAPGLSFCPRGGRSVWLGRGSPLPSLQEALSCEVWYGMPVGAEQ